MAAFSIGKGCRDSGGTNMHRLLNQISEAYAIEYRTTNSVEEALAAVLVKGAMVIANSGGDREDHKGVFSNGGHYVVLVNAGAEKFVVVDPGYYDRKYDRAGREMVVELKRRGVLVVDADTVQKDCANRNPAYYIVTAREG